MCEDALKELLKKANTKWDVVEKVIAEEKLIQLEYEGKRFYMRKLKSRELL